jgi:putative protease
VKQGARTFVCNAPWQIGLFPDPGAVRAVAGPFCNAANPLALEVLRRMGFSSAVVSPELDRESLLALPGQSPMPLGIVLSGYWPVGLSRHLPQSRPMEPLASPKGEVFWAHKYGPNLWIYPNWPVELSEHKPALAEAGYRHFIRIHEPRPRSVPRAERTTTFNWDLSLL